MPDKFKELIRNIRNNDEAAILSIKKNIETIVSNYLSKKYIEIDWIADEKRHYGMNEFFDGILAELLHAIKEEDNLIDSFSRYKEFVISKSDEKILQLFKKFYDLLIVNDQKVWIKFDRVLKLRIKAWLIKKGIYESNMIEAIYQDAISVFIKKMAEGELIFEDSRLLKSYIFKIIDLKIFEYQRKKKYEPLSAFNENTMEYADNYIQNIMDFDKTIIREKLLGQLNELEMRILTDVFYNDEKLKDIAQNLNISEANCRVIKHRALAKLEEPAKQLGYF